MTVADVHRVAPGEPLTAPLPGDLVLIRGTSWISAVVRFAQVVHPLRRIAPRYRQWSHVALVTSRSGRIVEVVSGGVRIQDVEKYRAFERRIVRLEMSDEARQRVARAARAALRSSQGLRGYAAYAVAMATAGTVCGAEGIRQNCAALIADLLAVGGAAIPVRADLTPADLARHFGVGS